MSHAELMPTLAGPALARVGSGDLFGSEDELAPARTKSKRTRIKEHRAKRNRRRFYVVIDGKERARDTGVRQPFTILPLPNADALAPAGGKTPTKTTNG